MHLRVTSLNATRTGYRVDGAGSDKPTKSRGPGVAGTLSAALAGLVRQQDRTDGVPRGAMQVYSVRGVSPASPGDDSEFGRALEAAADKRIDALLEGVDKGLSPADASAEADKALGKNDPQSNFAALSPVALRGVEGTNQGDGSIFDKVIDGAADRFWGAVGAAEERGASENAAVEAGNKAIGKSDPQANFSAGLRHAGERTGVNSVALRGRDEPSRPDANIPGVHYGDRDTFGSAINATADKQAEAYGQAAQGGASPSEAQDSANKAVGKSDPQANFSAGVQRDSERTGINNVALRDLERMQPGDGSIFDKVIDEVEARLDTVFDQSLKGGSSPEEARIAADKATGKIDPQANFSVRRHVLSSLAAALRLGRPHSERRSEAEQHRRPNLRPRIA